MPPFKTPRWRKQLNDSKYHAQNWVINQAVKRMEKAMFKAIDYVMEHYEKTGKYVEPSLQDMYGVSSDFYRDVIRTAFHSAQMEKAALKKHEPVEKKPDLLKNSGTSVIKRMGKWPLGIPKSLTGLEKIFRDKRYWPKIMKRSEKITDRVRKKYLQKLQIKFGQLLPDLDKNLISPAEAKTQLRETWDASKSRVELIFRTETTTYFGKTQTAFFENDSEIIGFLFDSIRDSSATEWCRTRHGLIYKPGSTGENGLAYNTPAIHWNCRSHLIPLANTPYNRKLLDDPNRNPENRKVAPLPPGWRT